MEAMESRGEKFFDIFMIMLVEIMQKCHSMSKMVKKVDISKNHPYVAPYKNKL